MALVNPHPALKVAAPMSPMVDGWMGDDWFHFGAFRQTNFDYITYQTTTRGEGHAMPREAYDDYETSCAAARQATLRELLGWTNSLWRKADRSILPMTVSGRGKRSTRSWPRNR